MMSFRPKRGISFRNKLMISFLLVSLIPMLAVQMVSYYVSSKAMNNKINDLVQVNLLQTSKNLDTSLQAYEDLLFQIVIDDEVMELTKQINDPATLSPELSRRKLINIMSRYSYAKSGIRSVAIFASNGNLIAYDQQTGSPYDNLWSTVEDLTELPIYRQAMSNNSEIITPPTRIDTINNKEQYGFHLARKLSYLNAASLEGIGVVVITVYESVLAHSVNLADYVNSQDSPRIDNSNFLTDSGNRIVSSPDKDQIGKQTEEVMGKSTILNSFYNAKSGLRINNIIDEKQLFGEMYAMQRLSLYAGLSAMVISLMLIFYFSGTLTRSIRNIVRAMRTAQQGSLDVQVQGESRDEFSVIAKNFNKMMNTVSELMEATKKAGEKQKEAEIRALEAQINPHFLYNTLDSINWLAIEKEEHQISQMLKELARILRYSVKDSNNRVALKDELQWMKSYVFLQQYRLRSSFHYELDCDPRALEYRVNKLLFQPFIENALIHGFVGMKSGGLLSIRVHVLSEKLFEIRIEDNGAGMTEERRNEIMANDHTNLPTAHVGIGIRNVFDRIRMYYGEEACYMDIQSKVGEGTIVRIVLPIDVEGEGSK